MPRMIFVNFPWPISTRPCASTKPSASNNPHFTDETAACMVWSEAIHVMLLTHAKWRTFTDRPIPPTGLKRSHAGDLHVDRAAVDAMNDAAAANGGTADINPMQDLGFMYSRSLADPDGTSRKPSGWTRRPSLGDQAG